MKTFALITLFLLATGQAVLSLPIPLESRWVLTATQQEIAARKVNPIQRREDNIAITPSAYQLVPGITKRSVLSLPLPKESAVANAIYSSKSPSSRNTDVAIPYPGPLERRGGSFSSCSGSCAAGEPFDTY